MQSSNQPSLKFFDSLRANVRAPAISSIDTFTASGIRTIDFVEYVFN